MGKASEIWKEIKPKIGEMLVAVNDIETQAEKAQEAAYAHGYSNAEIKYRAEVKEAYQKGLEDAWECAREIVSDNTGRNYSIFGQHFTVEKIFNTHSASEVIEEIRAHEQVQKEKDSFTAEEVMRQYLDAFCHGRSCTKCPLCTQDFTCGRGYHFITAEPVSDEEVRRAYATVLQKMRSES